MITEYQRLTRSIESRALSWILNNALDRSTVVKLCNACGLNYAGMRTKSIPSHKLVPDLVGKFFDQELAGQTIIKTLIKTSGREVSELRGRGSEDIASLARNGTAFEPRYLSRLIVAMALDEREAVQNTVPAMLSIAEPFMVVDLDHNAEPSDASPQALSDDAPTPPVSDAVLAELEILRSGIQSVRDEAVNLRNHNHHLEARVESLREQVKKFQIEGDASRHENRELAKSVAERERDIQRLTDDLKNMPAQMAQLHHVERENRKLRYDLEKERTRSQPLRELDPVIQTLEKNVREIKGGVESTAQVMREEHEAVRSTIDDLQKEVRTLRIEVQKDRMAQPQRRPQKSGPDRVGIFVDVQNMFYAARQYGARLDFEKLMHAAVGDRRLIRAIAYVIQTPEVDQSGFVAMLQQRSYQVRRKDLRLRSDGSAKGDWDMGMAIDMIGMADKLDTIVLVSGDGDFVSLVNLLKEIGPRVEVFSFPHNTARDLMEVVDRYYPIDEALLIRMDRQPPQPPENTPERVNSNSDGRLTIDD